MNTQDILGALAALLTTGSFLPQAWLTLRTRDVSGISLSMYTAFTAGVALWLVYGVMLGQWPIVVANAVTLALAATILSVKVVEERRQRVSPGAAATDVKPPARKP
jgi:MtN3 and saliva related transmembrane protein